jgi:hypothetical protein
MFLDLAVVLVVVANLSIATFFSYDLHRSISRRTKPLWRFVATYGVVSTSFVVAFYLIYVPRPSVLGVAAGIFYLLIGSFVFTIEVPGYLLLKRHDHQLAKYLEDWRSDLVRVGYSFQNFSALKSKTAAGKQSFEETNLNRVIGDYIEHSDRMQNNDKGLWTLTIGEVNRAIDQIEGMSKHPAPELIEVLSLSGLSFIIAQLLRVLG